MEMGEKIYKLLVSHGMTQRTLAEKIGVTEVSMSRYINGQRIPKASILMKMARELHTNVDYLLGSEVDVDQEKMFKETLDNINQYASGWRSGQKIAIVAALFTAGEDKTTNKEEKKC